MNRKQLVQLNPDFRILSNFSLFVLRKISILYPHWIKYAVIREFNKSKYLSIRVPAPVNPTDRDLIISLEIEGGRITVHFDHHHAHFYTPYESVKSEPLTKKIGKKWQVVPGKHIYKREYEADAEEQQFEAARLFIEDIINERRVVAIKMVGNEAYSGCNLYSAELDEIEPGKYTYIRSWLGTYNRTWE